MILIDTTCKYHKPLLIRSYFLRSFKSPWEEYISGRGTQVGLQKHVIITTLRMNSIPIRNGIWNDLHFLEMQEAEFHLFLRQLSLAVCHFCTQSTTK